MRFGAVALVALAALAARHPFGAEVAVDAFGGVHVNVPGSRALRPPAATASARLSFLALSSSPTGG
eukprot:CAMPEP_0113590536 /NCGR_PEP_ID=MMETSP0015_2-20120614/36739_1 /TAXON_ID=2838 /ORGANISM="Odontella" /LENGTH=65 /DNA_ID=CAMNT_0000496759 /DNA_START=17 /DNA_END=210 /DNA_ORIENTATION=+ /assembly_acc=CAM_ASM_000160